MDAQNERKLLTIAIPTYNRANDLKVCLGQIIKNLNGNEHSIELIVSDNNSTDKTEGVVNEYISRGVNVKYIKNRENIGATRNFIQCFNLAAGNYLWIICDDDVIQDGTLNNILEILKKKQYGTIHMRAYSYQGDFVAEKPRHNAQFKAIAFAHTRDFLKKTGHMITFASANIVNKDLVEKDINLDDFANSDLPHLAWIFSAMFKARENILIDEFVVAGRSRIAGYALCEVFGVKINNIFNYFVDRGVNKENFDVINKSLAKYFFPKFIYLSRKKDIIYSDEGDYYKALHPILKGHLNFWLYTVPAIKLPLFIVSFAYFLKEIIYKFKGR